MYGYHQLEDFDELLGCRISQVCIGENEIIINFEPEPVSVLVMAIDKFREDNTSFFQNICRAILNEGNSVFVKITNVYIESKQKMRIDLSNGENILFIDDSKVYESFVFTLKTKLIAI